MTKGNPRRTPNAKQVNQPRNIMVCWLKKTKKDEDIKISIETGFSK